MLIQDQLTTFVLAGRPLHRALFSSVHDVESVEMSSTVSRLLHTTARSLRFTLANKSFLRARYANRTIENLFEIVFANLSRIVTASGAARLRNVIT